MQFKVNLEPEESLTCQAPYSVFQPSSYLSEICPFLKRLQEIPWTSHFEVSKGVVENEEVICDILSMVSNDGVWMYANINSGGALYFTHESKMHTHCYECLIANLGPQWLEWRVYYYSK
jgi:hypothetical protein